MSYLEKHYDIKYLMEKWNMKEGFLRKEIRNGRLECKHIGSSVKFTESQIKSYYENYVK